MKSAYKYIVVYDGSESCIGIIRPGSPHWDEGHSTLTKAKKALDRHLHASIVSLQQCRKRTRSLTRSLALINDYGDDWID